MKVFVAGASGALGRPLVKQLVAAGYEVTGMTRREERAAEIRAAGGEGVVCDVFDAGALNEALVAAAPEVVVHALTALPPSFKPKEDYLAATNRVRTEGTRNLVAAARAAGARRLIAESVAFFYEPEGDWIKDEEARLMVEAPGRFAAGRDALVEMEGAVLDAEGLEGVVLRFGWFYGPGTYYAADGSMAEETRKRRNPVIGAGTGRFSFVQIEDAAAAIVAALDHGAPGAYNVVDDEPVEQREWLPAYAEALGAKPPRKVPYWMARLAAGADLASTAITMRGASTRRRSASSAGDRPTQAGARACRHPWPPPADSDPEGFWPPEGRECFSERSVRRMRAVRDLDAAKGTLLAELREHSLIIGEVTLASGATAQYYVDARRTLMRPEGFRSAGELIAAAARELGAAAVGGPATAAIPPACAAIAVPAGEDLVAFFVRGARKEHGLQRWVEGPVSPGIRCLVVEDTVTTGGSTAAAIGRVREEGLEVAGVVAVVDRLAGGAAKIEAAAEAPYRALVTIDEIYPERPDRD